MTRWVRFGLGAVLVVAGAILGVKSDTAALAASPVISISPAQQTVAIGAGIVTYEVTVANADNVAAYGFDLTFDHYVLEFQSAQNGPFLATSNRQPVCPGAILRNNNDTVSYGCATPGDLNGAGAAGSGLLTTLTFKLVGGGTSSLVFTKADLEDANASPVCAGGAYCQTKDTVGGSITVDGPVLARPTVDPNATPTSTPAPFQTPSSNAPSNSSGAASGSTPAAGAASGAGSPGSGTAAAGSAASAGSAATGSAPSGTLQGDGAQPGAGTSGGAGGTRGAAAQPGGAGVGRFGSGPDSYARGGDTYPRQVIALIVLGAALVATGLWRGASKKNRAG